MATFHQKRRFNAVDLANTTRLLFLVFDPRRHPRMGSFSVGLAAYTRYILTCVPMCVVFSLFIFVSVTPKGGKGRAGVDSLIAFFAVGVPSIACMDGRLALVRLVFERGGQHGSGVQRCTCFFSVFVHLMIGGIVYLAGVIQEGQCVSGRWVRLWVLRSLANRCL